MSDDFIAVPRTGDAKIIEIFNSIANDYNVPGFRLAVLGVGTYESDDQSNPGLIESLSRANLTSIKTSNITIQDFTITYSRDALSPGIFDKITFSARHPSNNNRTLPVEERLEIIHRITDNLGALDQARLAGSGDESIRAHYTALHEAQIEKLERSLTEQIDRTSKFNEDLQKKYIARRDDLEKEFQDRRSELDDWQRDQELEIRKQAEELQRKENEFDNRNNTHVRRELRNALQEAIGERVGKFRLSNDTRRLKVPLHIIVISVGIFLGYLLSTFSDALIEIGTKEPPASAYVVAVLSVRTILVAIALGALVWFYIGWLRKIYERAAVDEMELRQLQLDVDRASWTVEAVLEWQTLTDRPMPEQLLQSITSGLFDARLQDKTQETSAADQLASALLGSSARVKLQAGGSEIEIEKPKRLAKKKMTVA